MPKMRQTERKKIHKKTPKVRHRMVMPRTPSIDIFTGVKL